MVFVREFTVNARSFFLNHAWQVSVDVFTDSSAAKAIATEYRPSALARSTPEAEEAPCDAWRGPATLPADTRPELRRAGNACAPRTRVRRHASTRAHTQLARALARALADSDTCAQPDARAHRRRRTHKPAYTHIRAQAQACTRAHTPQTPKHPLTQSPTHTRRHRPAAATRTMPHCTSLTTSRRTNDSRRHVGRVGYVAGTRRQSARAWVRTPQASP